MKKRNCPRLLSTGLLLFLCCLGVSQSIISGKIADPSGEVLIGASLIIKETSEGTTSDNDGLFHLATKSTFPLTLVCSYTGYAPQKISIIGPVSDLVIILEEGIILSEDIVISASRRREKIQEAPASISVITSRDMEASPNDNPLRNLINEPGVTVQQQTAGRINIQLRGDEGLVYGSASLPMLDYLPLGGLGDPFDLLNSPVSNVDLDRVEVVRGPGSALYGTGVTSGVIHFISKSGIDHPGTTIEVMGGELNTIGLSGRYATKISDKLGFKFNTVYKRGNEFILDPSNPDDAIQIAKFQPTVTANVVNDGVVDLTVPPVLLLDASELDPDNDGNPMQDYWRSFSINGTLEFRPKNDLSMILSGGTFNSSSTFYTAFGEGFNQSSTYWLQGRFRKGGIFGQLAYGYNNGGSEKNPTWLYQGGNTTPGDGAWKILAQFQYSFKTPKFLNAEWTTGFDFETTRNILKFKGTEGLIPQNPFRIGGAYIQGRMEIMNNLDFVVASRVDRFSLLEQTAYSPRAIIVWQPSPKHTFRAGFNRATGSPTPLELNFNARLAVIIPGAFDVWFRGNREAQTFGVNPQIVFNGVLPFPDLSVGTSGLPLAYVQGAISPPVLEGITNELSTSPLLASYVPFIIEYLSNPTNFAEGIGGQFAGINLFSGMPLELVDAPAAKLRIENTWEFGYKGVIGDNLSVSMDVYNRRINGSTLFTAISPGYTLLGANEIPDKLGNEVAGNFSEFLYQLLLPSVGQSIPDQATLENIVNEVSSLINEAYSDGGVAFIESIQPLIGGAILATTPTEQLPDDGVAHLAAGFRTFDSYNYWGMDLGINYFINNKLSIGGSFSWINENLFNPRVTGVGNREALAFLNAPYKYRLFLNYTPEDGFRVNISFQHDPTYEVFLGQFSGDTDARNLVDAGVGYKFNSGLQMDLTAQNIFNNPYRTFPNFPIIRRRILGRLTYSF